MSSNSLLDLFEAVRRFLQEYQPGCIARDIDITLQGDARPLHFLIPSAPSSNHQAPTPPLARATEPPRKPPAAGSEPNDYQCHILEVLEYRALRSEALVAELDRRGLNADRRRLWKPGGIKELVESGQVCLDKSRKKLGYYRTDAPPDELDEPN